MAHQSTLVGWTPARITRTRLFAAAVCVAGLAVAWAMFLPWVGATVGVNEATCDPAPVAGSVKMRSATGDVVNVTATGCLSAYDSVQTADLSDFDSAASRPQGSLSRSGTDQSYQMAMTAAENPYGAPVPDVKMGIPAQTWWALFVALMVVLGLLVRNALGFVVALLPAKFAFDAFATHRAALTWGLEGGLGEEMYGVAVHQWSYAVLLFLSVAAAWLVLKGNHEQRKLDGKPHPAVAAFNIGATLLLRINADRLRENAASSSKP